MPVMDGKQATKLIRNQASSSECKIIAVTASNLRKTDAGYLELGFDDVLHKPFNAMDIFKLLKQHLGVHFKDEIIIPNQPTQARLSRTNMAALPQQWLTRFHSATQVGDINLMQILLQELDDRHSDIKSGLNKLLKAYNFEQILDLTQT